MADSKDTISIKMGDNHRKFIESGIKICLHFLFRNNLETAVRQKAGQALLASVLLLGRLGGLGSRSRRGFGTVALESWKWNNSDLIDLPIAHHKESGFGWLKDFAGRA